MSYEERLLQVLHTPMMTEKTTSLSSFNQYVFRVVNNATKFEVSKAVEKLFNVKVKKVNMLNRKGKSKTRGKISGKQQDKKIAFITLEAGHTINLANN